MYQSVNMGFPWCRTFVVLCWLVLAGLLGSKLFHVLFEAQGHVLPGGQVADGVVDLLVADPLHWLYIDEPGFVLYGGLLAGGLVLLKYPEYSNLLVQPISLGIAIGRVGCFWKGCCHGVGGWPVQLFEAIFVLSLGFWAKSLKQWILGYALWRFVAEFLRADTERGIWVLGLSTSQWISATIIAVILIKQMAGYLPVFSYRNKFWDFD